MNATLEAIERDALALPAAQRARLVDKLCESLGETCRTIWDEAWLAEIESRRGALLEGKAKVVAGDQVSRKAWQIAKSGQL